MKVVKNINNNVAICEDSAGNEVVVFSKGIGFKKPPTEVDIRDIERTFYHVDNRYLSLIRNISDEIVDIAMEIRDYAIRKNLAVSGNLLFSLIDHINFAIERVNKGMYFALPIKNDIRFRFEDEMEVGKFGVKLIDQKLKIRMPSDEACYIALNIINSETEASQQQAREAMVIEKITSLIGEELGIEINRDSISYSRFCTHMHYLLRKTSFQSVDAYNELLKTVMTTNPREYECALKVRTLLEESGFGPLVDDELLFITLHISRLYRREESE
ncbi:MAG: PRD domain-containing protein [Erysipelotrichaceae bacterium]|nr:PRD domain-containing protein [Erysipelotrichaceae bacterium]